MIRALGYITMLALVGFSAWYARPLFDAVVYPSHVARDSIAHRPSAPTIEQVRELAALVTLDVPISDVQMTDLGGFIGGVKLILAVHGDVQIATDLSTARFEEIDPESLTAMLVLSRPSPTRPRVDHEKTRILQIERRGLWALMPGEAGESAVTHRAMKHAQRMLIDVADNEKIRTQACAHTEKVMHQFFAALGWNITVQWDDHSAAVPETR